VYLDASVLLPLFVEEPTAARANDLLRGNALVISDFAAAEFSSAVARRARLGEIDVSGAAATFAALDADIAADAARLRASLRLKLADAVEAAGAIAINADALATRERQD
jgi:predicted nucleic acid-binding protein